MGQCPNVGRGHPESLQNLPGFGKMQNWSGLRPEQIGLPPPALSEGWIKCSQMPSKFICCDTIPCSCAWAQENPLSMHQVIRI